MKQAQNIIKFSGELHSTDQQPMGTDVQLAPSGESKYNCRSNPIYTYTVYRAAYDTRAKPCVMFGCIYILCILLYASVLSCVTDVGLL